MLPKNKEIKEWRFGAADGKLLKEETVFKEDATIFAVSKGVDATYTVERWQENIEDDDCTKVEDATETKTGESGKNTEAASKEYEDYTAQEIIQQTITADGKTVVQIKYKRNTVSFIIDLKGGTTTTKLVDGKGEQAGKKLLIGKLGATVKMESPTKENFGFYQWVPALPNVFMKGDDKKEYVADWRAAVRINIIEVDGKLERDERLDVKKTQIVFPYDGPKTWKDIKEKITENVSLKSDWNNGDYEIYDWRLKEYEGDEIKDKGAVADETPVTDGMNVYPRSNYARFVWGSLEDGKENHIYGYNGKEPRGKIIIPIQTIAIAYSAFENCTELTAVDFAGCSALKEIGKDAFSGCEVVVELNLTGCSALRTINDRAFSYCTALKEVNLKGCSEFRYICEDTFKGCEALEKVNLTDCSELVTIDLSGTGIKSIDLSPYPKLKSIRLSNCENIDSLDLTGCSKLETIDLSGTGIKSIDLSSCKKLDRIYSSNCKNLESVNLTGCSALTKLTKPGLERREFFKGCVKAVVKLPTSITEIQWKTFGFDASDYCKEVHVPNETIKKLVKDSGYPENRIKVIP